MNIKVIKNDAELDAAMEPGSAGVGKSGANRRRRR